MLRKILIFLLLSRFSCNLVCAQAFYVGGSADMNFSYPGGPVLRSYLKYYNASNVKKTINPGYDLYLITGYNFFIKDKSILSLETGLGNSMLDYRIIWQINTNGNTVSYFMQRWNKAINWYFGPKYSYSNISLTVVPLFLFKINYQETSYAKSNGQYLGYSYKSIIKYGDYIFGTDNSSKLDLYIKIDYSFSINTLLNLRPFIACQPALLYTDIYDFGPFAKTTSGSINSFSIGLSVVYNLKSKRR